MNSSTPLMNEGMAALREGRKNEARALFQKAISLDPNNERAWIGMAAAADNRPQQAEYLRRVLEINPSNKVARDGLAALEPPGSAAQPPPAPTGPSPAYSTPSSTPPPSPVASAATPPPPLVGSAPTVGGSGASPPPVGTTVPPGQGAGAPPPPGQAPPPPPAAAPVPEVKSGVSGWLWAFGGVALLFTLLLFVCGFALMSRDQAAASAGGPVLDEAVEAEAVMRTIRENIAATNAGNIPRYMATIHTDSATYDETRDALELMVANYRISSTLDEAEFLRIRDGDAYVRFVLTTRKISGPAFRDNTIRGEWILRQESGRWKIYDQNVRDVDYHDE